MRTECWLCVLDLPYIFDQTIFLRRDGMKCTPLEANQLPYTLLPTTNVTVGVQTCDYKQQYRHVLQLLKLTNIHRHSALTNF